MIDSILKDFKLSKNKIDYINLINKIRREYGSETKSVDSFNKYSKDTVYLICRNHVKWGAYKEYQKELEEGQKLDLHYFFKEIESKLED